MKDTKTYRYLGLGELREERSKLIKASPPDLDSRLRRIDAIIRGFYKV